MANTYVDYTATAGQTDFAFNFPYLEDEHVKVYINSIEKLQSDFSISTSPATKIVLNVPATGGETVRVRRKSQPNDDLVDFVNGSVLTESELDRGYRHTRYLAEEASEFASVSLELEGVLAGSQIEDGTVSTTKITDGAITENKLADGAVTTAKIADGAVTSGKISSIDSVFNVQSDGKVGIGTNTPDSLLHLGSSGSITMTDLTGEFWKIQPGTYRIAFKTWDNQNSIVFHSDSSGNPQYSFIKNKVKIGTDSSLAPDSAAILDVSGNGGILFPRLSTTQRNAFNPANGLVIYNTTVHKFQGYANYSWVDLH